MADKVINLIAILTPKPECFDTLLAQLKKQADWIAADPNNEPGTIRWDVHPETTLEYDPSALKGSRRIVVFETFKDREAYNFHRQTDVFNATVKGIVEGKWLEGALPTDGGAIFTQSYAGKRPSEFV